MKTTRLLRVLSLLGFLLLLAPFYDSCNGEQMHRIADANAEVTKDTTAVENDSIVIDSTDINKTEIDTMITVETYEESFFSKAYNFIDDDNSENAYEMARLTVVYFDTPFNEFIKDIKSGIKKNDYKGFFFGLKNFCFLSIVIITLLILIFSFKNVNRIYKLSRLNLVLLLITVICLFLEGLFETISQIKWGYYAFILTNLLIFYYSRKSQKKV